MPAARQAAAVGEQRVICQDGADAGEKRIRGMAHAVNFSAGFLGGDPVMALAFARFSLRLGQSELTVKSQGSFERDKRFLAADPASERFVQAASIGFEKAGLHFDAGSAKALEAAA